MKQAFRTAAALILATTALTSTAMAQDDHGQWFAGGASGATQGAADTYVQGPYRTSAESLGPFRKLVIRGAMLIDGTGGPPRGPIDIVIEGNRIVAVNQAGWPGLPMKADREPRDAEHEIDATGMYVMPGFVDTHVHLPATDKAPDVSYAYKLWLAHGVTSVRGVPLAPPDFASSEKNRAAANVIAAPRIFNYQTLGAGWTGGVIDTPEKARLWVRWAAAHNIDGIKFFNRSPESPAIIAAAIDEAHKNGLGTIAHLSQTGVASFNARDAGDAHLDTITHFYGHHEALLKDATVQDLPSDYNYFDEQQRFGDIAEIWDETYPPGSPEWTAYLRQQKANGVVFNPTFNIYAASRDLMRARNADWNNRYTTPQLWSFFQSTRDNHGSYFYDWTTEHEYAWKRFYSNFFRLMNDYKNMGGRVTVGTDSGFIFKTYGFAYVEELELFREAGFTPPEILRAATMWSADELARPSGKAAQFGVVRPGMLADLVIVKENPLANLKTLYGTGHLRLNPKTNKQELVGGVSYTIKDGIVYDAKKLLAEVTEMVVSEKVRLGLPEPALPNPGTMQE